MKDQIERFKELNETFKSLSEKKIRLEEQFKARKKALSELITEIKDAGYDPTKLNDVIKEKEISLKTAIGDFEAELQEVSSKIAEIEGA
jgi:DNA repair exonuclease SbcCD ATPase subunit